MRLRRRQLSALSAKDLEIAHLCLLRIGVQEGIDEARKLSAVRYRLTARTLNVADSLVVPCWSVDVAGLPPPQDSPETSVSK